MGIGLEILIVNVLIVINGIFSMSEMAIVSARKTRLQQRAEEGDHGAQAALELANAPNRFLSTVQVGITLVGIIAGAFGGAGIAGALKGVLANVPLLAPYKDLLGFGIVIAIITFLSLVIGELVPKRLALINPEKIACLIARPMRFLSRLGAPAVWLLDFSSELVMKVLRIKAGSEPAVTQEEIQILIDQGRAAGVVDKTEQDIMRNVFSLGGQMVSAVMSARSEIVFLDCTVSAEENWSRIIKAGYSHYPVCEGRVDQVLGMLAVKHLWAATVEKKPLDMKSMLKEPIYVPESMNTLKLLEQFKQTRQHVALVINEYGSIHGLVTLIDVMEAVVGELPQDQALEAQSIVKREDGTWLLDGLVPIEKFKDVFKIKQLPNEQASTYQTLAGFVMTQMGRIPKVSEHFDSCGYRFEVVDMDCNRIDKIMIKRLESNEGPVLKS